MKVAELAAALRAMHLHHIADGSLCWCPDVKFTRNTEDGLVLRAGYVHAPDCQMARAALGYAKEESAE